MSSFPLRNWHTSTIDLAYSNTNPQSLGCTLYALAYSHSPFENTQTTEQGGSIAMAVMNAQYKHPSSQYSQGLRDLIDAMLKVDPQQWPDIHQVRFSHSLSPLPSCLSTRS